MKWLVLGVVALAAGLRLYWVGAGSLDIDEGFTVWVARHSWQGIWQVLARLDDHPPLYYLILHFWTRVAGDHELALRFLSILAGVVTVAATYSLGSIVGGPKLGLLTAFFAALSPDNVQWSQEARMYALATLAVVLAMCAFAWLLAHPDAAGRPLLSLRRPAGVRCRGEDGEDHPGRRGAPGAVTAWSVLVVGTATALWTEYTAALFPLAVVVALGAVFLGRRDGNGRGSWLNWLLAYAAIGALCVPELALLSRQLHSPNVVNWYLVNPYTVLILTLVGIGLLALGRAVWPAESHWIAFTVSLWAVPIACLVLVSLRHPILTPRLYLWTYVLLYLAVSAGLLRLRDRWLRGVLFAALVAFNVLGLMTHYRDDMLANGLRGWDRAAEYVASRVNPNEVILFYVPYVQPAFDYYFQRYHRQVVERGVPTDFGAGAMQFPPLTDEDVARLSGLFPLHPRVWFIHGMQPSAQAILHALDRNGRLLSRKIVTNDLEIYLYGIRGPGAGKVSSRGGAKNASEPISASR